MHHQPPKHQPAAGPRTSHLVVLFGALLTTLSFACSKPIDRPLEGARPGSVASANSNTRGEAIVSASPVVALSPEAVALVPSPAASPVASPALALAPSPTATGRGPIISTIQPQANSNVPAGPVTISSRISATSNVAEVTMTVNGQPLRATPSGDARNPTYSASTTLSAGTHQARIQVRDDQGRVGGFSWSFTVGGGAPAPASPTPRR